MVRWVIIPAVTPCIIKSAAKSELLENKIQVKSCCENLHSVCTEASKLK